MLQTCKYFTLKLSLKPNPVLSGFESLTSYCQGRTLTEYKWTHKLSRHYSIISEQLWKWFEFFSISIEILRQESERDKEYIRQSKKNLFWWKASIRMKKIQLHIRNCISFTVENLYARVRRQYDPHFKVKIRKKEGKL